MPYSALVHAVSSQGLEATVPLFTLHFPSTALSLCLDSDGDGQDGIFFAFPKVVEIGPTHADEAGTPMDLLPEVVVLALKVGRLQLLT